MRITHKTNQAARQGGAGGRAGQTRRSVRNSLGNSH